jgi:hypothetical protein
MKEAFVFEDLHKYLIRRITSRLLRGLALDDFDLAYVRENCGAEEADDLLRKHLKNKCFCRI